MEGRLVDSSSISTRLLGHADEERARPLPAARTGRRVARAASARGRRGRRSARPVRGTGVVVGAARGCCGILRLKNVKVLNTAIVKV
jgi:hypothetical protein